MNRKLIKNISFVFLANIIAMLGSAVLSVLIPKMVSIEAYGYWQLNVLYTGYIAVFHFGWVDGIYVRYAGTPYDKLDKKQQHSQFIALLLLEILISVVGIAVCQMTVGNPDKLFAFQMVFVISAISIPLGMLQFILQGCDRIKDYSVSTIINKLLYLFLSIVLLVCGIKDYRLVIVASIIGALVSLIYSCYRCRDIVFSKGVGMRQTMVETGENIKCGIKVSIAYLTGNLIVGSIRYLIEHQWGIEAFGKASLTISMTHLLIVFINAVGIVLLPMVRNIDERSQKGTYVNLNRLLTMAITCAFILYYPLSGILSTVLPKYQESISMMAMIFPICLFESKMGLLNNTYLKALRKENGLLVINIIASVVTVAAALVVTVVLRNFEAAVMLILIMLAFRCLLADVYISRVMKLKENRDLFTGYLLSAVFVSINGIIANHWVGMAVYSLFAILTVVLGRRRIKESLIWLKSLLKKGDK